MWYHAQVHLVIYLFIFYLKITASEVKYNLVCEQTPVLFLLCLKGYEF